MDLPAGSTRPRRTDRPRGAARASRALPPGVAAGVLVAVLVVVVGVPLALDRDSFPLSTYPMFSTRRSATEPVDTAVLVRADGAIVRLDPWTIAGTDEAIIAAAAVSRAIRSGTADVLCRDVLDRLAGGAAPGDHVQVVTERFDALEWFDGQRQPLERTVHADCTSPPP